MTARPDHEDCEIVLVGADSRETREVTPLSLFHKARSCSVLGAAPASHESGVAE